MWRAQQGDSRAGWALSPGVRKDDQSSSRVYLWRTLSEILRPLWRTHPLNFDQLSIFFLFSPNDFCVGPFQTSASWCNQGGGTLTHLLRPVSFSSLDRNIKTITSGASAREGDGRDSRYRINCRHISRGAKNHIACAGNKGSAGQQKSWKGTFPYSGAKTWCHHSNTAFKSVQPILSSFRWQIIGPRRDTDWRITEKSLAGLWTTANLNW